MIIKVSICVRFDPKRLGIIGDAASEALLDIWNGSTRKAWVAASCAGKKR